MPGQTNELGLYYFDPATDPDLTFDITKALQENWEKVDTDHKRNRGVYANIATWYGNTKLAAMFHANEAWTSGAGTQAVDSTNFKLGNQSLKIMENDNVANSLYSTLNGIALDLSKFENGKASTNDDYIVVAIYISDATKIDTGSGGITLSFSQATPYDAAHRKYYYITQGIVTGWNFFKILMSAFSTAGTGAWTGIQSIRLGWVTLANSLNAYASFQLIQMVKKDPESAMPNPFQNNGVRDFSINQGEWFVGVENKTLLCRDLYSVNFQNYNALQSSALSAAAYKDFAIHMKILAVVGGRCVGPTWYIDASNLVAAFIYGDTLNFRKLEAGVVTTVTAELKTVPGDNITFVLEKKGTEVRLIAVRNGEFHKPTILLLTTALDGVGYLAINERNAYDTSIYGLSIATIGHSQHAAVAEIAKDIARVPGSNYDTDQSQQEGFFGDFQAWYGNTKLCALFQADETWVSMAGVQAVDGTNYRIGTQTIRITENDNVANQLSSKRSNVSLDLTKFNNGEASTDDDYIYGAVYISSVDAVNTAGSGIQIIFCQAAAYDGVNIKYINNKTGLVTGWNYLKMRKGDFITAGTGAWSGIQSMAVVWESKINSQNAYVSFQLLQLVKKDPLTAAPNPFQRGGERDFKINSGEYYVGLENNILVSKLLYMNAYTINGILGRKLFSSFSAYARLRAVNVNNVFGMPCFYIDEQNYITASLQAGVLYLYEECADVLVQKSLALTCAVGDIIEAFLEKKGTMVILKVVKNYNYSAPYILTTTTQITGNGYLSAYQSSGVWQGMEAISVSTTGHAYHADVAEIAKSLTNTWTDWIPTLTWTTATPAGLTIKAKYTVIGNTVFFNTYILTTDGNGATALTITLPIKPKNTGGLVALSGLESVVGGVKIDPVAYIDTTIPTPLISFYAFSTMTDGVTSFVNVSGFYELA